MVKLGWPKPGFRQALSTEEAVELASQIAALSKAGMPLGEGLRALADELPPRRLRRTVHRLADRLDAGDNLAAALESHPGPVAALLPGLMLAGVRSGRLAEVLEEYVDVERLRWELRRRVWLPLAYPLVLLVALAGVAQVFNLISHPFRHVFEDFKTELPAMTVFLLWAMGPVTWFLTAAALLALAVPLLLRLAHGPAWLAKGLQAIPLIGPPLRWSALAEFSGLMAVLLEHRVALGDALRLAAGGLHDATLARGCRRAADEIEAGRPPAETMAARLLLPASLVPLVRWGQRTESLPDAFRAAAEMCQGRPNSQAALLEILLLPVALLVIGTFIGFFIIAMFLPLIGLIQKLSG
ncbi:MAG: type II secretion system F family protein [Thermoguttaceae bacterium]